ncbi:MAG: 50S ribosomal protein L10 [Candidatus Poribacteria bacterium]
MPTPEKQATIDEIKDKISSTQIAILTEFQGLKVAEVTELRKLLHKAEMDYKVYKNTLIGLAAEQLGITGLDKYLVGTTALAFSKKDDLVAPSKVLKDFSVKHQNLKVKAGILSKKAISAADVNSLINLPPKEYIISMVLGGMQAPLMKFIGVLQAPLRDFVSVLKNLADKRGAGESTPESTVESTDNASTPETPDQSENQESQSTAEEKSSDQQTSENQ